MRSILITLFCVTLFSSCFDFIEKVEYFEDGSGVVDYKMNLSQSKTKLASLMMLDSIRGYNVPNSDEIEMKLRQLKSELKKTNGISNVMVSSNWDDFIFEVSFRFLNTECLNNALKNTFSKDENLKAVFFEPYSFSANVFTRNFEEKQKGSYMEHVTRNKDVLSKAQYIAIYKFSGKIKEQTNVQYSTSKSQKNAFFKTSFLDLIENKKNLKNTVILQ